MSAADAWLRGRGAPPRRRHLHGSPGTPTPGSRSASTRATGETKRQVFEERSHAGCRRRHRRVTRGRFAPPPLHPEPVAPGGVTEVTFSGVTESERRAAPAEALDYRLAAAGREAAEDERLDLLEQIYDPVSRRRRALVQPGWRCLEVGAGRGSMAVWLAEQVGPTGQVVATDVDTRYLSRLEIPNLEVIEHNILEDPLDALAARFVRSRLLAVDAVPPPGTPGAGDRADGRVPAPRRLARRRGRRLGDGRPRRSCAPAVRRLPAGLAGRRLVGASWIRQGVRSKAAGPLRALRARGHTR